MNYKEILSSYGFSFSKTCHCNGIYTEVYEDRNIDAQVRIHPNTQKKKATLKQYGLVVRIGTINDLTQFNELLKYFQN